MEQKLEHSINLQNNKLQIQGVVEIVSATEKAAVIKLQDNILQISGQNLKIEKLSPEEHFVCLSGEFQKLEYGQSKKGFLKRIFR